LNLVPNFKSSPVSNSFASIKALKIANREPDNQVPPGSENDVLINDHQGE